MQDRVLPAFDSWFTPTAHSAVTSNLFVQDEIGFLDNAMKVTAGTKVEWGEFTAGALQPTTRVLWRMSPVHSVWAAASRAVRVPSRTEVQAHSIEDVELDDDGQTVYEFLSGTESLVPEKLTAFEAGYRVIPNTRFSTDVTAFYNHYVDLFTVETAEPYETTAPVAGLRIPLFRANNAATDVFGLEAVAYWTVTHHLQLTGSYTRLQMRSERLADSTDESADALADHNARNLFYIRPTRHFPTGWSSTPSGDSLAKFPGRTCRGMSTPTFICCGRYRGSGRQA